LKPALVDKTPKKLKAAWLGGPPGKTFERIRKRLRQDNIEVAEQLDRAGKPRAGIDLVLINRDMISHPESDRQRALCAAADVPYVWAYLNYTQTRQRLQERGFVPDLPPNLTLEPPTGSLTETLNAASDDDDLGDWEPLHTPDPEQGAPVDPNADLDTQKEQLRLFLLNLPPSLRAVALSTNAELQRVAEDEAFAKAFVFDEAAVATLSDDALMRGLHRLKPATRIRLSEALNLL
jgi:hypothetical protein